MIPLQIEEGESLSTLLGIKFNREDGPG
ncbi:rCG48968 [Rattus norvegicus]|uniref:RCG48968 n=1 Tax=Rattus norvegicus TaxID=10116 RepID=A6IG73_RAT|nr:rCG48968 [Rattus norvegicus]